MSFIEIGLSNRKTKKLKMVFLMDDKIKTYHFGSKYSKTFVEGADKTTRDNYIKRHRVNENWNEINNGSLSRYILWETPDIYYNIKLFLRKFNIRDATPNSTDVRNMDV